MGRSRKLSPRRSSLFARFGFVPVEPQPAAHDALGVRLPSARPCAASRTSRLYMVPSGGGEARLMRCNTPLMNSWHSFSPNGLWLVFSSKSGSPYTQMFLTHLDEEGNDSPAVLIENATDANRAVNIPEFVNIPPGGLLKLDAPVTDYYRILDTAEDLLSKRQYDAAIVQFRKAVAMHPDEAVVQNSLGVALARTGRLQEAIQHYRNWWNSTRTSQMRTATSARRCSPRGAWTMPLPSLRGPSR